MRTLTASILLIVLIFVSKSIGVDLKCRATSKTGTCDAYDLVITSEDGAITSINGNNQSLVDYDTLIIRNEIVNFVPQNISSFFPKLKHLEISNSSLEWVTQEDIKELTSLTTLNLKKNKLEILDKDLFTFNTQLETINIRENQLTHINNYLFYYLKNLRSIDLEQNPCTKLVYPTHTSYFQNYKFANRDYVWYRLNDYCQIAYTFQNSYKKIITMKSTIDQLTHRLKASHGHVDAANKRISELQTTIDELTHRLKASDGNLDAALTNYRQQKLMNSNVESTAEPIESQLIELTCLDGRCTATDFKFPFTNLSIGSEHCENYKSQDITSVNIRQQQTLFLPNNLAEPFPLLNELSVTESGLCEIDYSVLEGLDLFTLNLTRNKIPEIPVDTFADLENLQELDMSFNRLQTLYGNVFSNLRSLKILYLNNNFLVSINLDIPKPLEILTGLFLQQNRLKFISSTLLTPLTSLTLIDLSNNVCIDLIHPKSTLVDIESTIRDNCTAPVELYCKMFENGTTENIASDCQVENLFIEYPKTKITKLNGVRPNHTIKSFILDKQSIKFFPFKLAHHLPNIQRIEIQQSNLTSLHEADFAGFSKLLEIVINGNNLSSSISEGAFDTVAQLELLDLASNNIVSLPMNIFAKLTRIHTLLLSKNQIVTFAANILPRKNSIEIFCIDNNHLEFIEAKTIRLLRKAKLIDLTENVCIDMKYEKYGNSTRPLAELSGEIDLNCSIDDL